MLRHGILLKLLVESLAECVVVFKRGPKLNMVGESWGKSGETRAALVPTSASDFSAKGHIGTAPL